MVTKESVKAMFKEAETHNIELLYTYDGNNMVCDDEGVPMMTLDQFVSYMKRKQHCDFESLQGGKYKSAYKCNECGTYVLDCMDKDLCCPVCSNYKLKTGIYWTKYDILEHISIKEDINAIEQETAKWKEHIERVISRNGLWDNVLYRKLFHTKKKNYVITLFIDDINNKFKLKGLHMRLISSKNNTTDNNKSIDIPLGFLSLKRNIDTYINSRKIKKSANKDICDEAELYSYNTL